MTQELPGETMLHERVEGGPMAIQVTVIDLEGETYTEQFARDGDYTLIRE